MRLVITISFAIALYTIGSCTASAQTVQLPTFNSFSVGTTVIAPDAGIATAGGVRRTGSSWRGYGPLPRGSAGSGMAATAGVRAGAVIHDFDHIDTQLLAGTDQQNHRRTQLAPNELLSGKLPSVAEIRRQNAVQKAALAAKPPANKAAAKRAKNSQTARDFAQRSQKTTSVAK
jgi:hypothetical protein